MSLRVYVLLEVDGGNIWQTAAALRTKSGVRMVDVLEDLPNLIMVVEASERQSLAKLTMKALADVENLTGKLDLWLTRGPCSRILQLQDPASGGKSINRRKTRGASCQ